jgi:protease-4
MALNADTLLDRIHLKTQARRWRMVALVACLLMVFVLTDDFFSLKQDVIGEGYIARFTVDNIILDDPKRQKLLQKIAADEQIKALILRIDSPGGSTVGSEELYMNIKEIAARKPVVCTMRSFATSGGYLAALGCDYIFALKGTITGSIGVMLQTAEISELAKKIGITPVMVRSGELKGAPTPFTKITRKERALLENVVDSFFSYFLEKVITERGLTDEQAATIKDGRIFSADQALALNLIDGIGSEKEALAWLEQEKGISAKLPVEEKEIPSDAKGLAKLVENVSAAILPQNFVIGVDGLVSIWQPSLSVNQP